MTIEEAVKAARNNMPVIYDSPMLGPMLYARIGSIRKDFALREDVAKGRAAESYMLELLSMSGAQSVMIVPPERVREATAKELMDVKNYRK